MQVIFDMDGVLVDSREAVRKAYANVGVIMPDEAWDQPWTEWLTKMAGGYKNALVLHAAKNAAYGQIVGKSIQPLFPAVVAQELIDANHTVCVVTSASKVAADLVLNKLGLKQSVRLLGTGLKHGQKKSNVRAASRHALKKDEFTIYVDDNEKIVLDVRGWQLPHLKAINYTGDDTTFVEEFERLWTLLSSLPVRMNA